MNEFDQAISEMNGVRSLEFCAADGTEMIHVMDGVPVWLGMLALAVVIILSHVFVNARKSAPSATTGYWTYPLFKHAIFKRLAGLSYFPMLAQSISIVLFLLVLSAGLWGNQKTNIGPVITWTWWWALLIFMIFGFGKAFCVICPWEGLSSWVTSLSLKSRVKKLGFEYKWPKWGRNIYPAIIFFLILTWFELGWNATKSPMITAIMGVVMASMAILCAIIFEKRAFCRYACLVGRVSGLYSMFSPVELRAQSADVCASCKTKDCYTGTHTTTACPTQLFPSKLSENSYCTLCTECVRSCPHENIGINLRPVGQDLFSRHKFKWDESMLAIVLLSMTSFHGLTMTPQWLRMNEVLRGHTGLGPTLTFTILMTLMLILPLLLFWVASTCARAFAATKRTTGEIFKAFAYSLIPIALFYHIAHNCMHFFMEAPHLYPLLSDPFGWGWDLFGTASKTYPPLLSLTTIWYLQVGLIVAGHVFGVVLADRYAKHLFSDSKMIFRSLIPLIVVMILYSSCSIWLVMQPMEMRSGM
jgi:polyferredoxin